MTTTFYKLHHANDNTKECAQCYVGSTSNFARRKSEHKYNCNLKKKIEVITAIMQILKNMTLRYTSISEQMEGSTTGRLIFWNNATIWTSNKQQKLLRERRLTEIHGGTLNVQRAGAMLKAGGQRALNRQGNDTCDTDNICDRCAGMYRGKRAKSQHQKTKKCARLTADRQQQIINIKINIENVNIN